MKIFHKTLLCSALIIAPMAAVQAHDDAAAHNSWLEAQKIDIEPTITIQETEIPADSATGAPAPGSYDNPVSPGVQPAPAQPAQPGYTTPDATMPDTGNQPPMPGAAPIEEHSDMPQGGGMSQPGGLQ